MIDVRRFEFRDAKPEDAEEAAAIERICFTPAEACTYARMVQRIANAPETFLIAWDRVNHKIAGYLDGLATDEDCFRDAFFTDAGLHNPDGKNVLLLGLAVRPEYRHNGLAGVLIDTCIDRETERGREKLLLTCLDPLVPFYSGCGFSDLGASKSEWGGEAWHEMEYVL